MGTKSDLRNDAKAKEDLKNWNSDFIRKEEGEAMRERIGAFIFTECSAKNQTGINDVFQMAARIAFADPQARLASKARNCSIL